MLRKTARATNNLMPFPLTIDVPEPFRSALEANREREACDSDAHSPAALFGRGLARAATGRHADARADFEASLAALGDPCRLELALLALAQPGEVATALSDSQAIAERTEPNGRLAARAWHIAGLATLKLGRQAKAIDALLRAADIYRHLGDRAGCAQVQDTLGMAYAARGRLDHAVLAYALALVDKTLLGDLVGLAITLGNLGRVHLREGRYRDAIDCFGRDLEIAVRLGDERGQARMHDDLGQAWLGLEEHARAEREFDACLALARRGGHHDLEFFALKDRAMLRLAQSRLDDAQADLDAAEQALPAEAEPYFRFVAAAARGELLAARHDPRALDLLDRAVRGFVELQIPDLEISARIALARALLQRKFKAQAEQCLLAGLKLARGDGYARYLPRLNEAMAGLGIVEGAIDEAGRPIGAMPDQAAGGYVLRERLGGGAFGEVFRAFDPQRNCDVALKRLHLDRLYDVARRRQLLASARVELEAASRVRHPGIVRVLAIGTDPDGGAYITQDFVPGRSLRQWMPGDASADVVEVIERLAPIADALAALHGAGIVHRDLKPENILVCDDGSPVLVDFGICQLTGFSSAASEQVAGTLCYMAPEQATGKRIDGRADLYALGVIAYEWLAGVLPLRPRGNDFTAMARDLARRQPEPLSAFRPCLNADIERFLMSLLAKKPRQRPASAAAVAEQLRTLAAGLRHA